MFGEATVASSSPELRPTPVSRSLAELLACPQCGSVHLELTPPVCPTCGWRGRIAAGILDFVDESLLTENHHAEVAAQTAAVDQYYENESKISCHWDRLSADDLPELINSTGTVLDLGCGTGTAGYGVKATGATVIGADLSLPCLRAAQTRLDDVVRVDAVRLPFKADSFDGIVSRGALHHMADPDAVLKEAVRVLKPGARAVFMDPREHAWLEPIKHALRSEDDSFSDDHHAYTPEAYRELIERYFSIVSLHTVHPLGILVAHGLDLLPIPARVPRLPLARALLGLDRQLDKTPLSRTGHLIVAVAQKTEAIAG